MWFNSGNEGAGMKRRTKKTHKTPPWRHQRASFEIRNFLFNQAIAYRDKKVVSDIFYFRAPYLNYITILCKYGLNRRKDAKVHDAFFILLLIKIYIMKILLTGATGYIGKRLLPLLVEQGHEIICCVR
jgi:hypothetical protein